MLKLLDITGYNVIHFISNLKQGGRCEEINRNADISYYRNRNYYNLVDICKMVGNNG
ncbi:MAG: hypothetical protein E3J87_00820 [Candidatus Cloacimonadota bacterium]|nr:MAG: hypothetical protein E3J87_00820 [Candidatus Cloacimonadota bacterium]